MLAARHLRPDRHFKPVVRSALLSLVMIGVVCPFALAGEPVQLDSVAVRAYNIPAGPLGATLSSFAVDANIALSFQPSLAEGLTSPALIGNYSTQEAVNRLLAGSGLDMVLRSDGSSATRWARSGRARSRRMNSWNWATCSTRCGCSSPRTK